MVGNVPNGLFAKGDTIARRVQQKGLARVAWLLQRIEQPLLHLMGGFGDNLTRKQDLDTVLGVGHVANMKIASRGNW